MMGVIRRPAVVLPLLIALGFAAARMYAAPASVSVTPSNKNFGNVAVGTSSAAQAFTLKNNQKYRRSGHDRRQFGIHANEQLQRCAGQQGVVPDQRETCANVAGHQVRNAHDHWFKQRGSRLSKLDRDGHDTCLCHTKQFEFWLSAHWSHVGREIRNDHEQSERNLTGISTSLDGDFARSSGGCGTTLVPGTSCIVNVTFTPTVAGTRTGTLTINHSAVTSPQTVPLSGTGATPGLVSIQVSPATSSVPAGLTQQFVATGVYNNNTTADLTQTVTWTSSNGGIASVSSTAGSRGPATAIAAGTTTITATAGSVSGNATFTVAPAALTAIEVTPASASIALGTTRQFTATGTYTNGSTANLTTSVTWSSSSAAATVNASGTAAGVQVGNATISASSGSITGSATLTVTAAELVSVAVTPLNPTLAKGLTQSFTATGTFTDGSAQNLTATASWSTSSPTVASISASGAATALTTGTSAIVATVSGKSGGTTLTVAPAALVSIAVTPSNPSIALGTSRQFTATGTYTDASTQDLTASVTWASSATNVATISAAGLASSMALGITTITAQIGAIGGSTALTVTPAVLTGIAVTPANPAIALGRSTQFAATGVFSDGSNQDITATVSWTSSDASVATISMASQTRGLGTSVGVGSTTIAATLSSITGSTTLTVTPAVMVVIDVTPPTVSLAKGTTQQLTATATYSDGTTSDVTATAAWASTNSALVGITTTGLASGLAVGTETVSATQDNLSGSASVQITAAELISLDVTPSSTAIPLGTTQQFIATGLYTDGSTQDLTATVHWSASDAAIATVSNTAGTAGLATSVGVGFVTVAATSGSISNNASLEVTPAALVDIDVTPIDPSIPLGKTQQFTALGAYTDGSARDITTDVTWSTSDALVAIVSNSVGSKGLATSASVGTTSITAALDGRSGSSTLTVGERAVVSIAVSPSTAIVSVGGTQSFTATATYTNNATADVTASVTWSSSATSIATVGGDGVASGLAAGNATITATLDAIQGNAELSVVALPSISDSAPPPPH